MGVYSSKSNSNCKSGILRVFSKDGRMVSEAEVEHYEGCGNVVDGPALEWLERQPRPRVWLSDGGVTGVDDRWSRDLVLEAGQICKRGRIERVEDQDALMERLSGRLGRR